jgi:hypothetical protein
MTMGETARIREAALDDDSPLLTAESLGVHPAALARAAREGTLLRLVPGVYISPDAELHALTEAAAWSVRFPAAVACCLTAAVHHDLTTAFERGTWLSVPSKTTLPRSSVFPVNAVHDPPEFLDANDPANGIDVLELHGVLVKFSGADRTVVDLWRHHRRISYEHAVEALRRRRQAEDFRLPVFVVLAERLGVWPRLGPILEGMMLR